MEVDDARTGRIPQSPAKEAPEDVRRRQPNRGDGVDAARLDVLLADGSGRVFPVPPVAVEALAQVLAVFEDDVRLDPCGNGTDRVIAVDSFVGLASRLFDDGEERDRRPRIGVLKREGVIRVYTCLVGRMGRVDDADFERIPERGRLHS